MTEYERCNDPDCSVSIGICGSLAFGKGKLDHNGYWEFPCYLCARYNEQQFYYEGKVNWPYPEEEE